MKATSKQPATGGQVKYLHSLYRSLGWDEETYRYALMQDYNVSSTKDLSFHQASELIGLLKAFVASHAPDPATPKQCGLIRHLWADIDYSKGANGDLHLNAFIQRRFRRGTVEDLDKSQAVKLIAMIKSMTRQAAARAGHTTVLKRRTRCLGCQEVIMWVELKDGRRLAFDIGKDDLPSDFHECKGGYHEN